MIGNEFEHHISYRNKDIDHIPITYMSDERLSLVSKMAKARERYIFIDIALSMSDTQQNGCKKC